MHNSLRSICHLAGQGSEVVIACPVPIGFPDGFQYVSFVPLLITRSHAGHEVVPKCC